MLGKELPALRQRGVDLAEALQGAFEALPEVHLTGIVGPVGQPDRERLGAERLTNLNNVHIVGDGLRTHGRVGVAERAELVAVPLVRLILEGVRVDRVKAQAQRGGMIA